MALLKQIEETEMKKIALALIFAVSSCSAVPALANYDKDLCEWSMTADESEVVEQIRADVDHIVENTDPSKRSEVQEELSTDGAALKLNYVLYCDAKFDNFNIVPWILG